MQFDQQERKLPFAQLLGMFLCISALGAVVGVLLIPSASDSAYILLKDNYVSNAVEKYETFIAEEGYKVQYVDALSRAYIAQGEVRKAATLLEEYNQRMPNRPDALRRLADIYLTSQQRGAYIAILEKMANIEPSAEVYAELLEYYTLRGDVKNQTRINEQLYKQYPDLMNGPPIRLAKLMASQGALNGAAEILIHDYRKNPAEYPQADVMFLAGLLARIGDYENLRWLLENTVDATPEPNVPLVIQLSQVLSTNNEAEFALQKIEHAYHRKPDQRLEVEIVNLEVALEQNRAVLDRQQSLFDQYQKESRVNPELITAFLAAAILRLDMPSVVHLAKLAPVGIQESTWLQIAEAAATSATPEEIEALINIQTRGNPNKETVSGYGLKLGAPSMNAAATANIMQLHQQEELSPQQRIGLARIFYFTSQPEASAQMLEPLNAKTIFSDGDYLPLANVYLLNQMNEEGLNLFAQIDAALYRKAAQFHVAHLLLKVASKKSTPAEAVAWLEAQPQGVYLDQLARDLYFVTINNNLNDLAYAVANFMYGQKQNIERAQMLMTSALRLNREEQVLKYIDKAYLELPEFELIKLTLLAREAQTNPNVKGALEALISKIMKSSETTDVRKLEALDLLITNNQNAVALPYLRERALAERTNTWIFAYIDAAAKTGNLAEVADLLDKNYDSLALTEEEKTNFAFYFLENDQEAKARALFKKVIAEYGPQSTAAENLVYLWTVNPKLAENDWLYKQATNSDKNQFSGWLKLLQTTKGYPQIGKAITKRYGARIPDNILPYYFTSQAWQNTNSPELKTRIKSYVQRQSDAEALNAFGTSLVEASRIDLALIVFERMLEIDPNNLELRVTAAQAMLNQANYSGAMVILEPVRDDPQLGWRGRVVYGLALNGRGHRQQAQPYLKDAHKSFPEEEKNTQEFGSLYAQVLFSEDERNKALKHYEKLLNLYPDVLELQTGYASLLLQDNQAAKAQKVLDQTGKVQTRKTQKNKE